MSKKNTISFNRMKRAVCKGYIVYSKRFINNLLVKTKLIEISNPVTSLDIIDTVNLTWNENKKWTLDSAITSTYENITLFINKVIIGKNLYTYDHNNKILLIHKELSDSDLIQVECTFDIIRYTHETDEFCDYEVEPVFDIYATIGGHNFL